MPAVSIREKFIKASMWSGLSMYFFFLFNFICQLLFSRILSPAAIGVFAFAIAVREIIGIGVISMSGGYIKSEGKQADFDAFMWLTGLAAMVQVAISMVLALYYFLYEHNVELAIVIILLSISQSFILGGQVYMATLEKKLEYKSISLLQGGANLFAGLVALFIAYRYHTVFALVARDLLGSAILVYLIYKKTQIKFCFKRDKKALKDQFVFGVKCAFARTAEVGFYRIPELLISFLLSKTFLGYFYQGRYLAYFPIKLFQPFTNSILFSFFCASSK